MLEIERIVRHVAVEGAIVDQSDYYTCRHSAADPKTASRGSRRDNSVEWQTPYTRHVI